VRCVRVCKSCKPYKSNILNIVQISVQCESISGSSGGGSRRRRSLVHRVASVCGDAALIVRISATMSKVTRHTTHVTRHTSHVTRQTSPAHSNKAKHAPIRPPAVLDHVPAARNQKRNAENGVLSMQGKFCADACVCGRHTTGGRRGCSL
jgi:hypothetical protein